MSKDDKDIFDFMNSLSEEDSMKLLEGIDLGEGQLSKHQRNKIKSNVIKELNTSSSRKKNSKLGKGFMAASIAALIIFTGFTPSGQKVIAEIVERLYFIPGIGRVQENKGHEVYVLKNPIKYSYKEGVVTVKAVIRDKKSLYIKLDGNNDNFSGDFINLSIIDDNGKRHNNSSSVVSSGGSWSGSYSFENTPEDMRSFKILIPDNSMISVLLTKAEGYSDYASIGPTDIKNGLGISLVPSKEEGKMKFNLVQHPLKKGRVEAYGQQIDLDNYGKLDITLKDDLGRQYDLELPKGYSPPLSEFYFVPKDGAKNYAVEIPEVSLTYEISKNIKFPIPKEGELEVNRNFDINGFKLTVKKVVRTENSVKVYVDTNYNSNKVENLSELRIEALNSNRSMGYGWSLNEENRTVEYFEFNVKQNDKSLELKIAEFNTILHGPWEFKFSAQ
jgi:hypothetical protein